MPKINYNDFDNVSDYYMELKRITPTKNYLYDSDLIFIKNMDYVSAITHKIELCRLLLNKLLCVDYRYRDTVRINAVNKASSFNQSLLDELK